jgi:hypothetical protein
VVGSTVAGRWSRHDALALGVAGASFERGAPTVDAPAAEVAAYFTQYRTEMLVQSLLMVLGAGALLWFLGCLRAVLLRAEGGTGRLTSVAFGAGLVGFRLQAAIQAPQSALAMASDGTLDPQLAAMVSNLAYALSVIAYVPVAVMLAAVAAVTLRTRALPVWIGWLSALMAATYLILTAGIVVDSGPLALGGWATYVPYTLMVIWLAATTTAVILRLGKPATTRGPTVRRLGSRYHRQRPRDGHGATNEERGRSSAVARTSAAVRCRKATSPMWTEAGSPASGRRVTATS